MDNNSEISNPTEIASTGTNIIPSSNHVYTSLLHVCGEANANNIDIQSTPVAAKDDFSILWNDQTQTNSKFMDTNLDDIEMNDELLDKLVTAILQDNTLDLHQNSEASILHQNSEAPNLLAQPQLSFMQTPKPLVRRLSEDLFLGSLTRARSQLITASTPFKAPPDRHFEVSSRNPSSSTSSTSRRTTNFKNQPSPCMNSSSVESSSTSSSGSMTRSRSASKALQCDSQSRLAGTPVSATRYNLRARSSARSQSNANSSSGQPNSRQKTPKDSNSTLSHPYQTRSRTRSNRVKVKAIDRCCHNLAVVIQRARVSMIARLRCGRSSIRLPTPKTSLESRRQPTPKKRLQPRRLAVPKAKSQQKVSTPNRRPSRRISLRRAKTMACKRS